MNKIIISAVVAAALLGGIIWFAEPNPQSGNKNNSAIPAQNNGTLIIEGTNNYDFGEISMAAGKVKYDFKIRNSGNEAAVIKKIYTSCMCTTAELMIKGKKMGPYGMPGHGVIPVINQIIDANEEATIEAVFDPAAHGPAGVGKIQRAVIIENNAGDPIELQLTAVVTP